MIKFNFDNTYTQLPKELFTKVAPTPVTKPQVVIFNNELAKELGIDTDNIDNSDIANIFSGNKLPDSAASIAQAYSGHQFGSFTTLGDGRAVLLGEQVTPNGNRFDLQFKGSGITPYSRRGDGRATLSSMLREYIFSESLNALNIPTTRSLAVISSGEPVYREQAQAGGILTRVAQSHIRVGTFQHARQFCSEATQQQLTKHTIKRHYPELAEDNNSAINLLQAVMDKQISLIVNWMRVGFIHGVMNTDNMLLSGESIDFGPCAFMNTYKPSTVFSSIDIDGRYAYENQPGIVLWNLTRLAESLLPQIDSNSDKGVEMAKEILSSFEPAFKDKFLGMMFNKIGISEPNSDHQRILERLTALMEKHKADYTNTFVQLMYSELKLNDYFESDDMKQWITDWKTSLNADAKLSDAQLKLMQVNNPVYIPRNNTIEEVLKLATEGDDIKPLQDLMNKVTQPYATDNFDINYMQSPIDNFDDKYQTFCGT